MINWKTTLAGVLAGAAQLLTLGVTDWKSWLVGLTTAAIGAFAKDANKQ